MDAESHFNSFPYSHCFLLFLIFHGSLARVDLFIKQEEMKRLLGIEGELWYMDNGVVNKAAAEYEMEILSNVDELYFSWANRDDSSIPYSISVKYEPNSTPPDPTTSILSIPSNGNLEPTSPPSSVDAYTTLGADEFFIRIPRCDSSRYSTDYRIFIRFEFAFPDYSNRTSLELRRRKHCQSESDVVSDFAETMDDIEGSGELSNENTNTNRKRSGFGSSASDFLGSATNLFYVSIGCLFGFTLIIASMIILYFVRASNGNSCCTVGDNNKAKRPDGEDVASSLLQPPPPTKNHLISSTPLENEPVFAIRRGCGTSGSVTSSSAVANERHDRCSASPSVLSKCTSAAGGGTSFPTSANPNTTKQANQQKPTCSDAVPRVFYFDDNRDVDVDGIIKRLMVTNSALELGPVLLEGTYGMVFVGRLNTQLDSKACARTQVDQDKKEDDEWLDVIVKSVKEKSSTQQINRFLHESLRFVDLPPQPNLCRPLCISSTNDEDSDSKENGDDQTAPRIRYSICFAHHGFGNLKKFLLRCRGGDSAGGAGLPTMALSTQDLVYAALQIIRGLLHLHKFHLLHRDVATRNCLVSHDMTIQICDTALSRDLFSQDYHCLGDNENRPIKWMSYESLERSEFSTASDVWAFGVTLWELTTLAQQPYADVDPFEMQAHLCADQRLSQPYNCPDELYLLMYCCWNLHPEARPTFSQLLAALEHFYAQLTQYI